MKTVIHFYMQRIPNYLNWFLKMKLSSKLDESESFLTCGNIHMIPHIINVVLVYRPRYTKFWKKLLHKLELIRVLHGVWYHNLYFEYVK